MKQWESKLSDEIEFEQKSEYIWESKYIRIYHAKLLHDSYTLSFLMPFKTFEKAHKAGLRLGGFIAGLRSGSES